jgi:ankyrin repeat protein
MITQKDLEDAGWGADTGNTGLHYLATSKRPRSVQTFIDLGAKVNARNNEGQTPLDFAAPGSDVERALLANGGIRSSVKPTLKL